MWRRGLASIGGGIKLGCFNVLVGWEYFMYALNVEDTGTRG